MFSNYMMMGGMNVLPASVEGGGSEPEVPDYSYLITGGTGSPYHAIYDMDYELQASLSSPPTGNCYCAAASHQAGLMALGISSDTYWLLYSLDDLSSLTVPAGGPSNRVISLAFSKDGEMLAIGSFNSDSNAHLHVYTIDGWSLALLEDDFDDAYVYELRFSPDGAWLAVGTSRGLYVYDTSDWSLVDASALEFTSGTVNTCVFSPDGSVLAVGASDSPYLALIDTSDWSAMPLPSNPPAGVARSIDFSPNGALMAVRHGGSPYNSFYETSGWTRVGTWGTSSAGTYDRALFAPDGASLWLSHGSLVRLSTSTWTVITGVDTQPPGNIRGIAYG